MLKYILLQNDNLPAINSLKPFKGIIIIECEIATDFQKEVSQWLVESGCLYMLAWGKDCSSWDDSVDLANLEKFDFKEVPEESFVVTTWHDNEPLEDVFWFAKYDTYNDVEIENILILHISKTDKETEFKKLYENS